MITQKECVKLCKGKKRLSAVSLKGMTNDDVQAFKCLLGIMLEIGDYTSMKPFVFGNLGWLPFFHF